MTTATLKRQDFLSANLDLMRRTLHGIGEGLASGRLDRLSFYTQMKAEIRAGATAQFRFALGRTPTESEVHLLNGVLERHGDYLQNFVRETVTWDKMGGVAARSSLYAGAGTEAAAVGRLAGARPESRVRWTGPDGPTSCQSCLSYIGREWPVEQFPALGVMPGRGTACAGSCRCRLVIVSASGTE